MSDEQDAPVTKPPTRVQIEAARVVVKADRMLGEASSERMLRMAEWPIEDAAPDPAEHRPA